MLDSKKGNLIIALIFAVILWGYVIGELDPNSTRSFKEIPIEVTGLQTLDKKGLATVSVSDKSMSLTVDGKRSIVQNLKKSDIRATVDLSRAERGNNQIYINVTVPSNVDVKEQSVTRVNVEVEKSVIVAKPVKIEYDGETKNDGTPETISLSPENIDVSGAQNQVAKVAALQGNIEASKITDEEKILSVRLKAVDMKGNVVDNIELSKQNVKVTSCLFYTKNVPLEVPVTGTSQDEIKRTYKAPSSIAVKGSKENLAQVNKITAKSIDLSSMDSSGTVDITPILPKGIKTADSGGRLLLTVTVSGGSDKSGNTKTITVSSSQIEMVNLEEGYLGTVEDKNIQLIVKGKKEELSAINADDIHIRANCKDFISGEHKSKLEVECSKKNDGITVLPENINITISRS